MTMAEAPTQPQIGVLCTGSRHVTPEALTLLCADLQDALAARYPAARFVLAQTGADAAGLITLQAFAAGKGELSAQLDWQAQGTQRVEGPRLGFSISDAAMTPAMQSTFLRRLVQETPLPF
jgi:hypothetical protein